MGQGKKARRIEPLKHDRDIQRVRAVLDDKPRDLLLFDLATQTGARMEDLLQLRVRDFLGVKVGERLRCLEGAISASTPPVMKELLHQTFSRYLDELHPSAEDYLFKSRKGSKPLHVSSVSHMIRNWFEAANFQGLTAYGSLRETWRIRSHASRGDQDIPSEKDVSQNMFKPLEASTFQDNAYAQLLKAIVSGRIRPGERLLTQNLARQMKVSPMPVREALGKLEALGFLSKQRRRGYTVNKLSKESLSEIKTIRLLLEGLAAERACLCGNEESLRVLEALHDTYQQAMEQKDGDEVLRVNRQFHFTVYRGARMPILADIIEALWNRVSPYLYIGLRVSEPSMAMDVARETIRTHRVIVEGMRARDPQQVSRSIKADIENAAELILGTLK